MKNKRSAKVLFLVPGSLMTLLLGGFLVDASWSRPSMQDKPNLYVGAAKCKNCHRAEEAGEQFAVWEAARHSKAFETLATDRAKEIAAEKGIENPQESAECMRCHRTGHGLDEKAFKRGFKPELGVQCETCHGPGQLHMKARMRAAATGDEAGVEPGEMTDPSTEGPEATEEMCRGCHNEESPTFQPFCFPCRVSKIRHLNPTRRTEEELAEMRKAATEACTCEADCEAEVCKH